MHLHSAVPDDLIMLLRSWREFAADVRKRPHSAFPRELLRAVAAVSKSLQGACGTSGVGGAAEAAQLDARAAADAVAAALIRVCSPAKCCPQAPQC
jgi:predicted signal transduction protein with EAL and GGDEF domain